MSRFPLCSEPAEALVVTRSFLRDTGFDADGLCRRFGIAEMSSIGDVAWDSGVLDSLAPPLRTCVDVFLRGLPLPADTVRSSLGGPVFDAFAGLGLLRPSKRVPGAVICPVWLYPVAEFVVASDRRDPPDDEEYAPGNDVVFPAIYGLTTHFLDLMPDATGRDALDLCGGTGIGAMVLARKAKSAVTSDLAVRAVRFAEFNARFNQVPVESLGGDLYEAVPGRTFDVVVAHPPFVPAVGQHMIFRDAGETGEDVTRRIVEGLPAYLRRGGVCGVVCWARDTTEAAFEERVADWLGAGRDDFDVIFGVEKTKSVEELVREMQQHRTVSPDEWRRFYERLKELHSRRFVYGMLVVVRREPGDLGPLSPARIGMAREIRWPDFARLVRWRRLRRQPDFGQRLLRSRPRLSAGLELEVRHAVQDGELKPESFTFSVGKPFRSGVRVESWMVPLLDRCTGRESVGDIFRSLSDAGSLKPGFPLEACLELIADSFEKGFLQIELAE